jgi:hypothetical protein
MIYYQDYLIYIGILLNFYFTRKKISLLIKQWFENNSNKEELISKWSKLFKGIYLILFGISLVCLVFYHYLNYSYEIVNLVNTQGYILYKTIRLPIVIILSLFSLYFSIEKNGIWYWKTIFIFISLMSFILLSIIYFNEDCKEQVTIFIKNGLTELSVIMFFLINFYNSFKEVITLPISYKTPSESNSPISISRHHVMSIAGMMSLFTVNPDTHETFGDRNRAPDPIRDPSDDSRPWSSGSAESEKDIIPAPTKTNKWTLKSERWSNLLHMSILSRFKDISEGKRDAKISELICRKRLMERGGMGWYLSGIKDWDIFKGKNPYNSDLKQEAINIGSLKNLKREIESDEIMIQKAEHELKLKEREYRNRADLHTFTFLPIYAEPGTTPIGEAKLMEELIKEHMADPSTPGWSSALIVYKEDMEDYVKDYLNYSEVWRRDPEKCKRLRRWLHAEKYKKLITIPSKFKINSSNFPLSSGDWNCYTKELKIEVEKLRKNFHTNK